MQFCTSTSTTRLKQQIIGTAVCSVRSPMLPHKLPTSPTPDPKSRRTHWRKPNRKQNETNCIKLPRCMYQCFVYAHFSETKQAKRTESATSLHTFEEVWCACRCSLRMASNKGASLSIKTYLNNIYSRCIWIYIYKYMCVKKIIYICVNICIYSGACDIYIFFQKNMTRKNMRFVNHTQCKHIWPWAKARLKQSESLMSRCWGERRKKSLPAVLPIYLQLFQTSTLRTLKSGTANLRDAPDCTSHTRSH